jgi:undecaprenyl-diphosphatase
MNQSIVLILSQFIHLNVSLSQLTSFLAVYLGWILFVIYILILVWRPKEKWWREFLFVFICTLGAWVLSEVIKYFYVSDRPFLLLDNFTPLLQYGGKESFPSGHATTFFAFGFAVYHYRKLWGNVFIIGAVLISLARIASGLHWPSDILGGFVLAGLTVLVMRVIFNYAKLPKA